MKNTILVLTKDEVRRLMDSARASSREEHTVLLVTYELGTRASETAMLRRSDLNFNSQKPTIGVRVLKRSKTKTETMPDGSTKITPPKAPPLEESNASPMVVKAITRYINESFPSPWVFPRKDDPSQPIDRKRVQYIYAKHAQAIGLSRNRIYHPHILRHSNGTHKALEFMESGMGALDAVKQLQQALRHATEGMALKYVHASTEAAQIGDKVDREFAHNILGDAAEAKPAGSNLKSQIEVPVPTTEAFYRFTVWAKDSQDPGLVDKLRGRSVAEMMIDGARRVVNGLEVVHASGATIIVQMTDRAAGAIKRTFPTWGVEKDNAIKPVMKTPNVIHSGRKLKSADGTEPPPAPRKPKVVAPPQTPLPPVERQSVAGIPAVDAKATVTQEPPWADAWK